MQRPTADPLCSAFEAMYGAPPSHVVRAPGRVNLIGEHIDYAGLPVLPMAIQREIRIAFRESEEPECRIASEWTGLEPRVIRLDGAIEPYPTGDWGNYAKAAVHGLRSVNGGMQAAVTKAYETGELSGIEALVTSDLPAAAGLGSSSALVIGCALALLTASGDSIPPLVLAKLLAEGERFTGTRGGGMDQAICLCAREGDAALIGFDPLRLEHVRVPDSWHFVVAFSLTEARKSGDVQAAYNRRRAAVEEALARVADAIGSPNAKYRDLLATHAQDALLAAGERALDGDRLRRFRHVVTEAERVQRSRTAMEDGDLAAFGDAMNASHRSLRDDFDVSTPELDELVELGCEAGAAGARLTGAGFGGSVVLLCPAERAARVIDALAARFYAPRGLMPSGDPESLGGALFTAAPSAGASVRRL